ncbi:MAG: SIMPL domain-containing protein [Nitrososphaerales archaeon]
MERNRIILVLVLAALTVTAASVASLSLLSPRTPRPNSNGEFSIFLPSPFVPRSPLYSEAQLNGEFPNVASVSGFGGAKMDPDVAKVTITILTESSTAESATREAAEIFNALIRSLQEAGIAEEQIRSNSFNLNPIFFFPRDQPPEITGYRLSHSLSVTVAASNLEDLGLRAGDVVDIATAAGVTSVSGIQFTVSDESMRILRNEALRNAILDAREKAEVIADALEVELVGVMSVSESSFSPAPRFEADFARAEAAVGAAPPTQVLPSEFEVTANVFIQYQIGP